jgi:hypothetical protein
MMILLVSLLWASAASAQDATATDEAAPAANQEVDNEISLAPFVMDAATIGGLSPATWTQIQPGAFLREAIERDPTALIHIANRNGTLAEALQPYLISLSLDELPDDGEPYTGGAFEWSVYDISLDDSDGNPLRVSIATADPDNGAYVIMMQSRPNEHEQLYESIFLPALEAFGQPLPEIYDQLDGLPLVERRLSNYNLETVIPARWRELAPGAYSRADITQDATTLLIQSSPDLASQAFGALLLRDLDLSADVLEEEEERYAGDDLDWSIYELTVDNSVPGDDPIEDEDTADPRSILLLALADAGDGSVLVALLTTPREADDLREAVLLPILDATRYLP